MRDKLRWLAVPPALALLLMFGPWRPATPPSPEPASTTAPASSPRTNAVPLPDLTQLACTIAGVCLLGVAVVIALARARQRRGGSGTAIVMRQSVKLSSRHAVHAVQFDDKILLLGECEGSLRVLHASDDPELVAARRFASAPVEPEDEGAVLKDMIIPRPAPAPAGTRPAARGLAKAAAPNRGRGLADFRTLLSKTQVEA